jgi:hypothetical protein
MAWLWSRRVLEARGPLANPGLGARALRNAMESRVPSTPPSPGGGARPATATLRGGVVATHLVRPFATSSLKFTDSGGLCYVML